MDIQANAVSELTSTVLIKSGAFAKRLQGRLPTILCEVGHFSNEAFLLRSFVSLRSDDQSDELAMSVDITTHPKGDRSTTIRIDSDLCLDDGTILATGPSGEFDAASPELETQTALWSEAFDVFLNESEDEAIEILRKMRSAAS
jgi:hypothetical protein